VEAWLFAVRGNSGRLQGSTGSPQPHGTGGARTDGRMKMQAPKQEIAQRRPLRRCPPGPGWACRIAAAAALVCLGIPATVSAQAAVRAWVDKDTATLEDQITLTVSLSGEEAPPSGPQLPPLPDFHVAEGGRSSHIEFVNFRKSSSIQYTYYLLPKRAGVFTIGPVRVRGPDRTLESRPIQVRVLPPEETPDERPAVFITQEVDDDTPYLNQQLVYTFRFFQRSRVAEAQWDAPSFDGFWVEDLGKERHYETVIGGMTYSVTEIRKALFPLAEGVLEIPEGALTCKVVTRQLRPLGARSLLDEDFFSGAFFGGRGQAATKILRAAPVSLDVSPLPAAGRPEGFQGLVGSFSLRAEVGDREIRRGDSTTLTVTVSGEGNLRDLVELGPEEIPGFRIYPDKPSIEIQVQGNRVVSTRVFKKALVPMEEGTLVIPPVRLPFFDPGDGEYRVARTDPIPLSVAPGDASESAPQLASPLGAGGRTRIQVVGQDILPIHTGLAGARDQAPRGAGLLPYLLVLGTPALAFLACAFVKKRKDRLAGDPHILRRKQARSAANRELKEARKEIGGAPGDRAFYGRLSRSLKGLIGDKLNLSALAFTPAEIRRCLREKGVKEETVEGLHAFLEELEYRQFVSGGAGRAEREAQFKQARKFLALLDRKL